MRATAFACLGCVTAIVNPDGLGSAIGFVQLHAMVAPADCPRGWYAKLETGRAVPLRTYLRAELVTLLASRPEGTP